MKTVPLLLRMKKKEQIIPREHKLLLFSLVIFFVIFTLIASAIKNIWFREDDLGTVYNLQVHSLQDLATLFSTDDRATICPVNYQRSKPNLLSGFLRPMQHLVFTLIYPFFTDQAYAYFLFHVTVHAINGVLLFLFSCFYLPRRYAFFSALLFVL